MVRLLLLTHLGMGDMLVCNGMVRQLCARAEEVVLVCKHANLSSVQFMYRDVPNLLLLPVRDDSEISPRYGADGRLLQRLTRDGLTPILLGFHSDPERWAAAWEGCTNYAEALYAQAGLPAYTRYTQFYVRRDPAREAAAPGASYAFVHEDPERQIVLRNLPDHLRVVRPPQVGGNDTIFDYCGLIENAEEVHVFDSAFAHLVDLLGLNPRRFLHAYARNPEDRLDTLFGAGWTLLH